MYVSYRITSQVGQKDILSETMEVGALRTFTRRLVERTRVGVTLFPKLGSYQLPRPDFKTVED